MTHNRKIPNLYLISTIYNMSGRVVSDIQTRAEGESLYIWYNTDANVVNDLWNSLVLWIFWRSNFENTSYITRENQSYSLCKSTKICIAYTDAFTLMISFVFSSWIINEFHNGNCTEWRAIWSEIKWLQNAGVRFVITSLISDQNCPTRSAISTLLYSFWNLKHFNL